MAQFNLARLYYNGEGTEKNLEKAFYWYQKAAEKQDKIAQFNLALLYYNSEGTEKNLEKAFYWYQKAAENGYIKAQNNLATLYENGKEIGKRPFIGIKKLQKMVLKWHNLISQDYIIKVKEQKEFRKSLLLVSKGSRKGR